MFVIVILFSETVLLPDRGMEWNGMSQENGGCVIILSDVITFIFSINDAIYGGS